MEEYNRRNLHERVIYKINVKRLVFISSVYPIGFKFSVLAARKMERGPKMTKGGGGGGGERWIRLQKSMGF